MKGVAYVRQLWVVIKPTVLHYVLLYTEKEKLNKKYYETEKFTRDHSPPLRANTKCSTDPPCTL